MTPEVQQTGIQILAGDCLEFMATLAEESIDAIVTDPPYGLNFMGRAWDHGVPGVPFWAAALQVLKPGGYLLAFGGTRTQHRLVCAIEDAGFEIRDNIAWVYGSGFPKSHNLDGDWQGWGTALKPALEPICVARKPLIGTVARNVLEHGTGAMNIDGCRVAHVTIEGGNLAQNTHLRDNVHGGYGFTPGQEYDTDVRISVPNSLGRWPANLVHDGSDEVLECFPESRGQQGDLNETGRDRPTRIAFGNMAPPKAHAARGDSGSAARFFAERTFTEDERRLMYCAKASRTERGEYNDHATVKPLALMRWLVRLVTPPGGTVLDPFAGSGTTGLAAQAEGFNAILMEKDEHSVEIARQRIFPDEQGAFVKGPVAHRIKNEGKWQRINDEFGRFLEWQQIND